MLSRRGICYNLLESPYRLDVPYDNGNIITYVFSARRYKDKFYNEFLDHREMIAESLSKRFGINIKNDVLSDVRLYKKIEKRGFLLERNEDKWLCQEDIILDGVKLMKQSSVE